MAGMQPQQYPPQQPQLPQQPQPPANDPYHFIMNPQQPAPRRRIGKPSGLLAWVGIVAVVVVLFVIIFSILRGGSGDTKPFVTLVQEQQEIVRIASAQASAVQGQNVKNFVMNTQLSIASDQTRLKELLSKNGVKVSEKQLEALASTSTDAQLTSAASSSTLDATLVTVLQKELTDYQSTLSQAYKATSNKPAKALLADLNEHAALLLAQSKQ